MKYRHEVLLAFAAGLAERAGLPKDRARVVARHLLEGDLMGHTTHGLTMLPAMLKAIEDGSLRTTGEPTVVSDHPSAVVWEGGGLPGPWLINRAIEEACTRAASMPVVTYVIRGTGHTACLGAYLRSATDRGMVIVLMNSNPGMRTVAPAGAIDPQLAANPLAFGYPTEDEPILIDISTSPVANGWIRRWANEGKLLPEPWLQDAEGNASDDPKTLFGKPPGSMIPLGGPHLGHKGFALGLIVEILAGGLAGTGRANRQPGDHGTPVFLQIFNPDFFAGSDALKTEASWLADACRTSRPRKGQKSVRMPGDSANASRAAQLRDGVSLHPGVLPGLEKWAHKLGVALPQPQAN